MSQEVELLIDSTFCSSPLFAVNQGKKPKGKLH